jgi:hypothetical protein
LPRRTGSLEDSKRGWKVKQTPGKQRLSAVANPSSRLFA